MRYERKIPIRSLSSVEVENIIRLHPSCFREIYHKRKINNIYFDDFSMNSFHDNLSGRDNRLKFRVRWYGKTFGKIEPVLELKIKQGVVGTKKNFNLKPFIITNTVNTYYLKQKILENNFPIEISNQLSRMDAV